MKIIVLIKIVPDTYGDRKLSLETGLADRSGALIVDEISERALECALQLADSREDVEITVLSMCRDQEESVLRKALAIGGDKAVQIVDDELLGADVMLTALTLAKAVEKNGFDLVIAGNSSTDGAGGVVPAALAEHLGVPLISGASEIAVDNVEIKAKRSVAQGVQEVAAQLPAVVSITEKMPPARLPNFKSIVAAKKKPLDKLPLAELGVDFDPHIIPANIMLSVTEKPARQAGQKIVDTGDAGKQLADYLVQNRLV